MFSLKTALPLVATVASLALVACSGQDATLDEPTASTEAALTSSGPHIVWQNTRTGAVGLWATLGSTVFETPTLDATCGAKGNCSTVWQPIDVQQNNILWHNLDTGEVSGWNFDGNGHVTFSEALTQSCNRASGCSTSWKPIGRTYGRKPSLLWHNPTTGEVNRWNRNGAKVTSVSTLSLKCGPDNGCAQSWEPVLTVDIDGNGETDILWFNKVTGIASFWLLEGDQVLGTRELSWSCNAESACSRDWRIVGAADVNGDRRIDLTWHNQRTGEVSSWLLDGAYTVTGRSTPLSTSCNAESGCSADWRPLGYTNVAIDYGQGGTTGGSTGDDPRCEPGKHWRRVWDPETGHWDWDCV